MATSREQTTINNSKMAARLASTGTKIVTFSQRKFCHYDIIGYRFKQTVKRLWCLGKYCALESSKCKQ